MVAIGKFAKIGLSWAALTFASISAFVLAKQHIDAQRYENMKIRERIRNSNIGEYEKSYRHFD